MELESCVHLNDFMKEQRVILKRHIDKHQYYRHIAEKNKAVESFLNEYAWLMREMYCDAICPEKSCPIYKAYLAAKGEINGRNGA